MVRHLWARTAALLALTLPAIAQGPVILMGIDAEDGGTGGHGPITAYEDVIGNGLVVNVSNGGSGLLVIGGGKSPTDDVTEFWNDVAAGIGEAVTYVNGATNISAQSFTGFAIVAIASSASQTPSGGLTNTENSALAGRAADIANHVNGGGGLFGTSQQGLAVPYGYLGSIGSFTFNFPSQFDQVTATTEGEAVGITDTNLDICCWHDEYLTFPGFLEVLATNDNTGNPCAIGGLDVIIVQGIVLTPLEDTNPVGTEHTVTATVADSMGDPVVATTVTFEIVSGPNAGLMGSDVTDSNGQAFFTWMGNTVGTDEIEACFIDNTMTEVCSALAIKHWIIDCNLNGVADEDDIAGGTSQDCDGNGIPDECDPDCDGDGTPDACEPDCDGDGIPDDCDVEPDCDGDGVPDACDTEPDCNTNGIPDNCDIADGTSTDLNGNGIPDECDRDCDGDGIPDDVRDDCDGDGVPDDCEPDCDRDGLPDDCELDCDGDGIPDDCGSEPDCNGNGVPDNCDIDGGTSDDCDGNGVPDECDADCDGDGLPDACEADCDSDGTPDDCEADCDGDGLPDDCEVDCDGDGIPDDCDSEPDCNNNGVPDNCDIASGTSEDVNGNGIPDECEEVGIGYCGPNLPNSTGLPGGLLCTGSNIAADQDITLTAYNLPPGNICLFIASMNQGLLQPPRSCGNLCLMGPDIARFRFDAQTIGPDGICSMTIDPFIILTNPPQPILAGQTWYFQGWHRDAAAGPDCNNNFTDACCITFQ